MAAMTFQQLVQAAQKLKPEQKAALVQSLRPSLPDEDAPLTREQALAELEALRAAGAFERVESLRDRYAHPGQAVGDEELNTYLRDVKQAWEQDLDDLSDDN